MSIDQDGLHPFVKYVLRKYYQATGWNDDNQYSNLTRSSDGMFLTSICDDVYRSCTLSLTSLARLLHPSGTSVFHFQGSQPAVPDFVSTERLALIIWLYRIHIFFVRP